MQARNMILTALIGGPLAGVMMGVAADPRMKPPPEPAWRSARPDPAYAQPQQIVETGPQDLSPTWYLDRMPTWKRRAAEREAAAYARLHYADYAPEPAAEPPAPEPEPASSARSVTWSADIPMAEAGAAESGSERDARNAAGAEPAGQPALVEAASGPAL